MKFLNKISPTIIKFFNACRVSIFSAEILSKFSLTDNRDIS